MRLRALPLRRAACVVVTFALTLSGLVATAQNAAADITPPAAGTLDTAFNNNIGGLHYPGTTQVVPDGNGGAFVLTKRTATGKDQDYATYLVGHNNADGSVDRTFDANMVASGLFSVDSYYGDSGIQAIAVDHTGKLILAGWGVPGYVVRMNPNGTVDSTTVDDKTFNENTLANAESPYWPEDYAGYSAVPYHFITVDDSNNIYVSGASSHPLVKVKFDGTLDTTWQSNFDSVVACAGFGYVTQALFDSSGRLVIGGFCNPSVSYVRRILADGSRDTSFAPPSSEFPLSRWGNVQRIFSLTILDGPDSDLIPGDGDVVALRVKDNNSSILLPLSATDGSVNSERETIFKYWMWEQSICFQDCLTGGSLGVDEHNRLYVGLDSDNYRMGRGSLFRLDLNEPDTNFADSDFNANIAPSIIFGPVLAVRPDGSGFAASTFQHAYDSSTVGGGVLKWNTDGTPDSAWTVAASSTLTAQVRAVQVIPDPADPSTDKWIVTLGYDRVLTRFHMDGTVDTTWGNLGRLVPDPLKRAFPDDPYQPPMMTHDSQGNIYLYSTRMSNQDQSISVAGIIKIGPDGTQDATFAKGAGIYDTRATLESMTLQDSGKLLISGRSYYGGLKRISASGVEDAAFTAALDELDNSITANVIGHVSLSDGQILLLSLDPFVQTYWVSKLNSDGTLNTTWGDEGRINLTALVMGEGSWTPSVTFDSFTNANKIIAQSDGSILISTDVLYDNGARPLVVKLNEAGLLDTTFTDNSLAFALSVKLYGEDTYSMTTDATGAVILWAGQGDSIWIDGFNREHSQDSKLYRLNANGTQDTTFTSTLNFTGIDARTFALQRDSKILAGGWYWSNNTDFLVRIQGAIPEVPSSPLVVTGATGSAGGTILMHVTPSMVPSAPTEYYVRYRLHGSTDAWASYTTAVPIVGPSILVKGLEGGELYDVEIASHNNTGTSDYVGTAAPVIAGFTPRWSSLSGGDTASAVSTTTYTTAMSVAPDGTVYAVGNWTELGGVTVNHVAMWDQSHWSAMGSDLTGLHGTVTSIAATPDDQVYVGGNFTIGSSATPYYLARWDGSYWVGVDGLNETVQALASISPGRLLVGGDFTDAGGTGSDYLVEWVDGDWVDSDVSLDGPVTAMTYSDWEETAFIVGTFTTSSNGCALVLAYYEPSSSYCLSDTGGEFAGVPTAVAYARGFVAVAGLQTADDLLMGGLGLYDYWNGQGWAGAGSDLGFSTPGGTASVTALAGTGDFLYIGGNFNTTVGTATSSSVVKLDLFTGEYSAMGGGTDTTYFDGAFAGDPNAVRALATDEYGNVYVGGDFGKVFRNTARTIAIDGTAKVARYGLPPTPPGTPSVAAETGALPGTVKVTISAASGAAPTRYQVHYRKSTATSWTDFTSGGPFLVTDSSTPSVVTVTGLDTSAQYEFEARAVNQAGYSGWGSAGTSVAPAVQPEWSSLAGGLTNGEFVTALEAHHDGKVFAGGSFSEIGGVAASNVAVYDKATGQWAAMGAGLNGTVRALFWDADSELLYAGGDFTDLGGATSGALAHAAKWNGTEWLPVGQGLDGSVLAISTGNGGKIYFGGSFDQAFQSNGDAVDRPALVEFNGTAFTLAPTQMTSADTVRGLSNGPRDSGTECLSYRQFPLMVTGSFSTIADWANYEDFRGSALGFFSGTHWNSRWIFDSYTEGLSGAAGSQYGCNLVHGADGTFGWGDSGGTAFFAVYGGWVDLTAYFAETDRTYATLMNGNFVYIAGTLSGSAGLPKHNVAMALTAASGSLNYGDSVYINAADGTDPFTPLGGGVNGDGLVLAEDSDGNIYLGGSFTSASNASAVAGTAGIAMWAPPTAGPVTPSLSYSATTFTEAAANDGSVDTSVTITLTDDTFTGSDGADWSSRVTNVPGGLTAVLTRTDSTHLALSFTGKASSHADENDVTDLTVTLSASDFTSAVAPTGATKSDLIVDFNDPTVSKTDVTVTAASPASVVFGTSAPSVGYTTSPATTAGQWTIEPSCAIFATTDTGFITPLTGALNAGTYVTHCSGGTSDTYNPTTYNNGTFVVTKAQVTVTASSPTAITEGDATPPIGYTDDPSLADSDWTAEPTCEVYAASDTTYSSPLTGSLPQGTYVTHCHGGLAPNYDPTGQYVNGSLTVNPSGSKTSVALTASTPASVAYGTVAPSVDFTTVPSTVAGDYLTAPSCAIYATTDSSYSHALTGVLDAGSYVTHCAGGFAASYSIASRVNGTFTVSKAPAVQVSADAASFTRGGTAATLGYTASGFVNSESFSSGGMTAPTCAAYATSDFAFATPVTVSSTMDAGSYTIHCSGADVTGNYTTPVTYVNATLTVSQTALTLTASSPTSVTYGTAAPGISYSDDASTVSGDWTSVPSCAIYTVSDTSYTTPKTGVLAAGTYVTHCSGGTAANYSVSSRVNGSFEVTAASAPSVTADNASFTRGGTAPSLTYTPAGFVNSETFASAGMSAPSCAAYELADTTFTTAVAVVSLMDAGTYRIHCKNAAISANYTGSVGYTDGTLTVSKTPVTVTASSPASVQTGTSAPAVSFSTSPATAGSDWSPSPSCAIYATTDHSYVTQLTGVLDVGTYTTHCSGGLARNFDPTSYVDGTFEVTTTPPTPRVVTYSTTTLFEATANDGSITTVATVALSGDTFTGTDGDDWSAAVTNVPDGLTASLTRTDSTHLTLTLIGRAESHANSDDIANLTVTLGDGKFTGGSASGVTGATRSTIVVDFADPGMLPGTSIKVEVKVEIGTTLSDSNAELTGNGLMPEAPFTFEMHSTTILLASGVTDAVGALHATVTLPPGVCVEPGVHELVLTSTGPDGTPVQAVQYVTLGASCTVWSASPVQVTQVVIDNILFPFRTAALDRRAIRKLRSVSVLLRQSEGIIIYGYTQTNLRNDSKQLRLANVRLGKQRARVVAEYLRRQGVTVTIKIVGRGAVLPKSKRAKYQWMNRRAVIVARFAVPEPPD